MDETKYKTLYTPDGEVSEKINITEQNGHTLVIFNLATRLMKSL